MTQNSQGGETEARSPRVRIALILARSENGVIGAAGGLPWHIPADLQHFKRLTVGKPVVMGRKTFVSIGRALPRRLNIVITRDRGWRPPEPGPNIAVEYDLLSALAHGYEEALRTGADEVMIIGGADLFHAALPMAGRIYLTEIHRGYAGDVVFDLPFDGWRETSRERHEPEETSPPETPGGTPPDGTLGGPAFSFVTLDRPTAA